MVKKSRDNFFAYAFPSMFSMLLAGMYSITDGYFLTQALGEDGLTAINLAWPVLAFMTAVGTGIGIGGSVVMSIKLGEGDDTGAQTAKYTTITMLLISAAFLMTICFVNVENLLTVLGAREHIFDFGKKYLQVICYGTVFQILGSGLVPILKNIGRPIYAMFAMVFGLVTNIALDALFMMKLGFGLEGLAIATNIAQLVVAIIVVVPIIKSGKPEKIYLLDKKYVREILKIVPSPTVLTYAPAAMQIITNFQCLSCGGNLAVAIYTVMLYAAYVVYSMMQGLADGVQPLLSFKRGENDEKGLKEVLIKTFALGFCIAFVFSALFYYTRYAFPVWYGVSEDVAEKTIPAMIAVSVAAPLIVIVKVLSAYFYALGDSKNSSILVFSDPFLFTPLYVVVLPKLLGMNGIWLSYPAAQASIALLGITLYLLKTKNIKTKNNALSCMKG